MHMFECPFDNDIRLCYQKLFTDIYRHVHEDTDLTVWNVELCDPTLRTLMNGNGTKTFWSNLADYLSTRRRARQEALDCLVVP